METLRHRAGPCPHSPSPQGGHISAQCSRPFPVSRGRIWCWYSMSARDQGSRNPNWQDLPGKHLAITATSYLRLTPFWPGIVLCTESSQDSQKFRRFTLWKHSVRNNSEQLKMASYKCHQQDNGYSWFTQIGSCWKWSVKEIPMQKRVVKTAWKDKTVRYGIEVPIWLKEEWKETMMTSGWRRDRSSSWFPVPLNLDSCKRQRTKSDLGRVSRQSRGAHYWPVPLRGHISGPKTFWLSIQVHQTVSQEGLSDV